MSRKASGLKAWVWQRATALYLGGFLLWLIGRLLVAPPADYPAWRGWFASPGFSVAFELFLLALLLHAWIGVRDVIIDYVHPLALKLPLLLLVGLVLAASGLYALHTLSLVPAG